MSEIVSPIDRERENARERKKRVQNGKIEKYVNSHRGFCVITYAIY